MEPRDFDALMEMIPYTETELQYCSESQRVYTYLRRCVLQKHISLIDSLKLEVLYRSGSLRVD